MFALFAEPLRSGDDIPGVVLVGVAMGVALLIVAIRYMFDPKDGKKPPPKKSRPRGGKKGSSKGK